MTPPPADLLPCPFCNHVLPIARGDDGTYWVQCVGCGTLGPTRSHRADAIAAWNRCPQPIAGDAWEEAIEAAAKIIETNTILYRGEGGWALKPRMHGQSDGLYYAEAIRALRNDRK
jgi:hypothetical protein